MQKCETCGSVVLSEVERQERQGELVKVLAAIDRYWASRRRPKRLRLFPRYTSSDK
jgi:hypothetical protein